MITQARFRQPETIKKPKNAKPEREPLPDQQVADYRAGLKPDQLAKLNHFVGQAALAGGYQSAPRIGGPLWEKFERGILEDWICHEVDVDELQISAEED